jgi:hypothetical protein
MRTPARPLPDAIVRWTRRARYFRWLDFLVGWLIVWGGVALALPRLTLEVGAVTALVLVVGLAFVPLLGVRWRPVSGWVGLRVSRRLRPGDRAWWVTPNGGVAVLVTARRRTRLTIATAQQRESEVLTVRRTRALVIPATDV